jgi:hypothetical protein
MKKTRKPRATQAALRIFQGIQDTYVTVIPYDRKGREIPSSVSCVYNTDFYTAEEARAMVKAL